MSKKRDVIRSAVSDIIFVAASLSISPRSSGLTTPKALELANLLRGAAAKLLEITLPAESDDRATTVPE